MHAAGHDGGGFHVADPPSAAAPMRAGNHVALGGRETRPYHSPRPLMRAGNHVAPWGRETRPDPVNGIPYRDDTIGRKIRRGGATDPT